MRSIDKLNGLKSWWNHNAKPEYKNNKSADKVKTDYYSEYINTGNIEMPSRMAKDNRPHHFL